MSCIEHSPCRQATWIGSLLLYFLVVTLVSYVTSEGLRFLTCKVGVMCTPGTVVRHHEVTALGTKSSSPEKDEISPIKCWGSRLAWLSECWWRRQWHPTPVLLPGKSHGWRSLVGCSPWGCEESDTTKRLPFHFFTFMHWRRKWQPTPVFSPGESQGRGSLVGCRLWGCTESDTTEAT